MIEVGMEFCQEKIVGEADLAINVGSGGLEVFSTPSLLALMEKTAFLGIEEFLDDETTSVGIHVQLEHLRATLISKKIVCNCTICDVSPKIISFSITVSDEAGIIGKATHKRCIVSKKRFMDKLN